MYTGWGASGHYVVSCSQLVIFMCIIKAAEQNQRAQSDPTLCRCAIKPKLYCNESLLGKSYVSIAAHALEGTNLLL